MNTIHKKFAIATMSTILLGGICDTTERRREFVGVS
jgi:hypothetical protein